MIKEVLETALSEELNQHIATVENLLGGWVICRGLYYG